MDWWEQEGPDHRGPPKRWFGKWNDRSYRVYFQSDDRTREWVLKYRDRGKACAAYALLSVNDYLDKDLEAIYRQKTSNGKPLGNKEKQSAKLSQKYEFAAARKLKRKARRVWHWT